MPRKTEALVAGDPRTLVEQAWRQIYATDADRHPYRLAPNGPRFIDYAWEKFDPKMVMTILISQEQTYPALKPILFAGLCTWMICPNRPALRKHSMLLNGIRHLRAAELNGGKVFAGSDLPGQKLLGDILGRIRMLGQDFFSDFYYPIGGLTQVMQSTTPGNFRRSLIKHSEAARSAVSMMEVYDYHAKHLSDPKRFYEASEGKGYALVRVIRGRYRRQSGVSVELTEDRWRKLGLYRTAALTYSASTLPLGEDDSLFDAMCAGTATFETHGHLLPTLIARARYATEVILKALPKPEIAQTNAGWLPDHNIEITPEPRLSTSEQKLVEAGFSKDAILGGRWLTEQQLTANKSSKQVPKL